MNCWLLLNCPNLITKPTSKPSRPNPTGQKPPWKKAPRDKTPQNKKNWDKSPYGQKPTRQKSPGMKLFFKIYLKKKYLEIKAPWGKNQVPRAKPPNKLF